MGEGSGVEEASEFCFKLLAMCQAGIVPVNHFVKQDLTHVLREEAKGRVHVDLFV